MTISALKNISGMKASVVQTYDFADIAWFNNLAEPNLMKWGFLATVLAQVGPDYFIRDKFTNRWTKHPDRASAVRSVFQMYGGLMNLGGIPQVISMDDVKVYASVAIVTFARTIYAPGMPDFVVFAGKKCLNTYLDERLVGNDDDIDAAEEFLKVVRGSLCNEDGDLGLVEMIDEITGPEVTPFKWVMHWLAARYQIPGFSPMTNLWFIGRQRGTGKGTLVDAMRGVMGSQAVGKANQGDVAKGWTNSLSGHQIIEWDEFKAAGGWREFNNLLKEMTGNKTFLTNERNVGGNSHPNVAMHIFTTNEERPILVEANDRQNTFINTTEDVAWRARSTALWNPITSEWAEGRFLSGFAALLNSIEVDIGLVSRPFKTTKFTELAEGSSDTVEQWVGEGGAEHTRGNAVPWDDLHLNYKSWVRDHLNAKADDLKEFKRKMIRSGFAKCSPRKIPVGVGESRSVRCAVMSLPKIVAEGSEIRSDTPILQFPARRV